MPHAQNVLDGPSYSPDDVLQTAAEKTEALRGSLQEVEAFIELEQEKLQDMEAAKLKMTDHPFINDRSQTVDRRSDEEKRRYQETLNGLRTLQLERNVLEAMLTDVDAEVSQVVRLTALKMGGAWTEKERSVACDIVQKRIEVTLGVDLVREELLHEKLTSFSKGLRGKIKGKILH